MDRLPVDPRLPRIPFALSLRYRSADAIRSVGTVKRIERFWVKTHEERDNFEPVFARMILLVDIPAVRKISYKQRNEVAMLFEDS